MNESLFSWGGNVLPRWIITPCLGFHLFSCNLSINLTNVPILGFYEYKECCHLLKEYLQRRTYPEWPPVSIVQLQDVSIHSDGGKRWLFPRQRGAVVLSAAFLQLEHRSSWDWGGGKPGQITACWDKKTPARAQTHTNIPLIWVWVCSAGGPVQYLSFKNFTMNLWIHNASIKDFRFMNINTPNLSAFLSNL